MLSFWFIRAADNFKAVAEGTGRQNFHGAGVHVCLNVVGLDTAVAEKLEEILAHTEVSHTYTLDAQADSILTRVELTVFIGNIIFKLQQVVAMSSAKTSLVFPVYLSSIIIIPLFNKLFDVDASAFFEGIFCILYTISFQLFSKSLIGESEYFNCKESSIPCTVYCNGSHGNTRRHLDC